VRYLWGKHGRRDRDRQRGRRRYGCGFHREKGSHVCANNLTVKIDTIERTLLAAIREKVLHPAAVRYLVMASTGISKVTWRRPLTSGAASSKQLEQVNAELAMSRSDPGRCGGRDHRRLAQDREAQRQSLRARLQSLDGQCLSEPLRVDEPRIESQLAKLDEVLNEDSEPPTHFSGST